MPGHPDDERIIRLVPENVPSIGVVNKIDQLGNRNEALVRIEELAGYRKFEALLPVSALKGDGLGTLSQVLGSLMPESPPLFGTDAVHGMSERFIVEEFVREKLYRFLDEELPYTCAVELKSSERSGKTLKLHVVIHVDRQSRKAILIGRGGEMVKRIGTSARAELERLLNVGIYLDLKIRVTPDWNRDPARMQSLGIGTVR